MKYHAQTKAAVFCGINLLFSLNPGVMLPASPQIDPREVLAARIAPLLAEAIVPGMSIAVIEDGRISWHGGLGVKNAETGELVADDTVFEAASLSKPVFAYAVMKLIDRGQLDLDKPLVEYVAETELNSLYPVTKNGDPRYRKITPRMVLTHSTGFPNWFNNRPMSFLFDPGERFSYSGEGYSFLAATVRAITGKSFDDFMREMVFEPLGMKDSSYVWREAYEKQFAASHDILGRRTPRRKSTTARPGASLYTTAADYGRFLVALGSGEGLSPGIWKEMIRSQIEVRGRDGKGELNFYWGLGVGVQLTEKGASLWHWGDNGDFNSYFQILPEKKQGVVFFMNGSNAHALTPIIARDVLGLAKPAIATAYFDYPALDSPAMQLIRASRDGGMARAVEAASKLLPDQAAWRSPAGQRFLLLARIALSQGDFPGARMAAELYMKHLPDSPAPWVLMAGAKVAEGDRAGMASALEKAIGLEPQLEGSINILGQALLGAQRTDEAIVVLEYNAARYPKSANCLSSLGDAWLKKGEQAKAAEYYRKALAMDPDLQTAQEALQRLKKQ